MTRDAGSPDASLARADRGSPPSSQPIRPFRFPEAAERRLSNGLPLHVISRSGFPLATVVLAVKGGEASAPAGKGGLPSLCGDALVGGTASRGASELALAFESIGAGFATATTWDAASATVSCLAEHLPRAMELHAETVQAPAFPESEFDRCKARQLAAVRQRSMSPGALAADVHARLVFGEGSLYGRPLAGTTESLAGLDPSDAAAFARQCHAPEHAALIVAGDVEVREATALAERFWGDWRPRPDAAPATGDGRRNVQEARGRGAEDAQGRGAEGTQGPGPEDAQGRDAEDGHGRGPWDVKGHSPDLGAPAGGRPGPVQARRRVTVVHRPGSVQSEIRTGHVGVSRSARDFIPLQVFNLILGGSFSSRLNLNLRERRGLTYGVRSAFSARRSPGPFYVSTAVDASATGVALAEVLREIEGLARDGPTAEEVAATVSYMAGVFPTRFQGLGQVAAAVARLFVYDLPADYYRRYRARVRSVTREHAAEAGRARLREDDLRTVVVGDADKVLPTLESVDAGPIAVHEDRAEPPTDA